MFMTFVKIQMDATNQPGTVDSEGGAQDQAVQEVGVKVDDPPRRRGQALAVGVGVAEVRVTVVQPRQNYSLARAKAD